MKATIPLSKTQYGIYVECASHQGEVYYNLPHLYILDGSLDGERLCKAVEAAVTAHPTLFTRITLDENGEPQQTVDPQETFTLSIESIQDIEQEKERLVVPFNIFGDRLFHIRLMYDGNHYYLFQDFLHIIADGTSLKVILDDISAAYNGESLAPEAFTLADVVRDEAKLRDTPAFDEDKQWYAAHFDCSDTFTQLMPDLEEPTPAEASLLHTLTTDSQRVDTFCKEHSIFRSSFFTAAYSYLLAKFNNEQESLFTTIYDGRKDKRFMHSVGMAVRMLPVYGKFTNDTTVVDFIKAGQEQMSGCRQHDAYSYSDIASDLGLQSNSMFAWHGMLFATEQMCGKPMKTVRLGNSTRAESLYLKAFILNNKYHVKAEYNANEYSQTLIAQFLESYEAVVEGFLTREFLRDIDISTTAQIKLLDSFNNTDVEYDVTQTIVSLFRRQAQATPDNIAVVFKDKRITYQEVDEISDRIASFIYDLLIDNLRCDSDNAAQIANCTPPVVSVLIPRCEWMAIASLGVLKAGCAYQPLDPTYPKERLNFMMQDADTRLLIADAELRSIVDDYKGKVLLINNIEEFASEQRTDAEGVVTADSLFVLLYTSGSTGVPKGCQLTHGNLVAFCHWYQRFYQLKPGHNVAAYASYGFDACLMDMYPALTCGATVHIIPEELRLDLMALNDYFNQNHITHSFMTTQMGYQFVTSIDNHSLLHLSVGGEKMASLTPPKGYQFYNVYGPTECTIFTTFYRFDKKMKEIPIGKPLDNMRLYIVDPQGHRLPIGAAGELWVSGPQVCLGYLNRPEKTAEVFIPNPFENDNEKYKRVYRTGDIVRYLPSGDIQFVGRSDSQVKIRGFRIELKEVESIIRDYPGIKDATVQAFEEEGIAGGKFIAAYIVSEQQIDIDALNNFILNEKPSYMVPAVTMQIDSIPLNHNQKVNKRALPKPERSEKGKVNSEEFAAAPLNVLEQELHDIISSIVNNKDFGIVTVLGHVGLTSISAIKLAIQVNKRYGINLDAKTLVKTGTLQSIENEILRSLTRPDSSRPTPLPLGLPLAPPKGRGVDSSTDYSNSKGNYSPPYREGLGGGSAPLSFAQTGVYFECLKNPTSTIYNIPYLLTYPKDTDAQKLADAVATVVKNHPELSVHFTTKGDDIIQTTEDSASVSVSITEMSDEALKDYKKDFVRPFNLQKAPLYRFEVVKTGQDIHLLMDVHHLIFDGGSADLFIRETNAVLDGKTAERERYTYFDFVTDQQQATDGDAFRDAQQFFAEKLQSCKGASAIPAELSPHRKERAEKQGGVSEAVCPVCSDSSAAITTFCRHQEITPAHLFLAATAYVVSRHTNSREVFLCTVSSGRSNLKITDTVGMFVNTLVLGLSIDDVTVSEFLRATSTTFDETLRHEDYPFASIATDYAFRPAIAYAYQVDVLSEYTVGGKPIRLELLELNAPKFKINIKIESRGVVVQYDDSLYSARIAQSLAESIVAVAERMTAHPDGKIRRLSIVSKNQEEELSHLRQVKNEEWKNPFHLFHECISHFACTQPDHEALIACDAQFTYQEMDETTNRIAAALRRHSVKEGDRVALLLPRTSRLILALFGVLKAGAAYIPCDPEYPADRVKLILQDSEARYVITTADRLATVPTDKAIDVESLLGSESCDSVATNITPDDLAYLIYTSGSTGRPKGVMLRHEGICNYLYGHPANVLANAVLTDADRILSVTTIAFDAALQDIGMAFFNGKTLILATEEQANNPLDLAQLINEQHINMVSGTPSRWQTWLTSPDFCDAIARVNLCRAGGEKFPDRLLNQLRCVTKARIFNCYGPTETTVASNNKELTYAQTVTVGKPQLNVKEFIVDCDGNELPVGVVGELYIGGRGVAKGYHNLDEMTRERFIEYHGERIYKSGDYAKWLPDGDVVILGRTDHQIKLRGQRIELGEIENVMLKVEGLKKAVVLIRKDSLCAYYTADREIAPAALKAEISKSLAQYMVPTAYLQLAEMPMTPNGKTDVKALPEPQLANSSAYTAPANDTEKTFCDIFANVLQMDKVGATDNFFELGGTSLVVTRVIIEADKAGLHVAYGDVFANPTPRQLAGGLTPQPLRPPLAPPRGRGVDSSTTDYSNSKSNYSPPYREGLEGGSAIDNLLHGNTLDNFLKGERQPLGNVLLTGATGYLGIHLLRELISLTRPTPQPLPVGRGVDSSATDNSNSKGNYSPPYREGLGGGSVGTITCLVRAKDKEKAKRRLQTMLFYYFDDKFEELFTDGRLNVITGDITDDLVSLIESQTTPSGSLTVINCAAIVKHFSEGTEIEDVNIGGARRCIDFCIKTGARLVHISTVSTRGLWVVGHEADHVFTEQRLYIGQYLGNKYVYSKFMAERLILDAVALHGLNAKIMRVGNLAARSTDGEFQANFSTNSFMGRIKVFNMLGCCPHSMRNKQVELSPINEVSRAIVLLATTPKECTVFHPYNIHGQFLGDVLKELTTVGNGVRFVEQDEFDKALEAAKDDPKKARQLASLLAYQDMAHGQKTLDVSRDNDYTTQVLYRLGFEFSPTSWDYVERMLTAIGGFGFFEE